MRNQEWVPSEGGCDCKQIRYCLESKPIFVHCCHCRWCQRESGAAFALNAIIETDRLTLLKGKPEILDTPTASGLGQQVARCPTCRIAVWSEYGSAGPALKFVRVGTLDNPELVPPDIHIFTSSKLPWVILAADIPAVPEFYDRKLYWPEKSLKRRAAIKHKFEQRHQKHGEM